MPHPSCPATVRTITAPASEFAKAAELINNAKRPLIFAGQGILKSGATAEVLKLAKVGQHPDHARRSSASAAIPASSEMNLGMMGMHGEAWVNEAIQQADLLIALGMRVRRPRHRQSQDLRAQREENPRRYRSHEINKNVPVDVALIGDLLEVLAEIQPQVKKAGHPIGGRPST